jgi:uncharacterized protein (DUF1015 family)
VPRFEPFHGIRYDLDRLDLADAVAPPYDVIDDDQRAELAARSEWNAVRIDLPVEEDGIDRYEVARQLLHRWLDDGVLITDAEPSFTVHRMAFVDDRGIARHTTGVIGAMALSPPGDDILPHEHTTPKAKSDRLDMLRACRANLSAIWGLSLAKGLTALLPVDRPPLADLTDEDGVRHTIWRVDDPAAVAAISAAVAEQPVVIADGHHRYETSLTYQGERAAAEGSAGAADLAMTYVVELVEDELTVRPIHRLIAGIPDGLDLEAALSPAFDVLDGPAEGDDILGAMDGAGALGLVLAGGRRRLLRPRPDAMADARDLDSSRLDVGLALLPAHELTFQHGVGNVERAVGSGRADAGVLLRPATVAQIEATAHGGDRMPPKTTFFHPKPKTGLVFRSLD